MNALQAIIQSPNEYTRRFALEQNVVSRTSVQKILRQAKFKHYVRLLSHGLLMDDSDRRLQFREIMFHEQVTLIFFLNNLES